MDKTTEIVDAILLDLTDRRGIRQAFDEIDDDIKQEMRETLIEKVAAILAKGGGPEAGR